jgi:hypothetical protein
MSARPRGLPIGNLTRQFFANVLLDRIDHFVKERLGVPGYVRYCDDLVLFGDDKAGLWAWRRRLEAALAGLRLRADKTQLRPARCGLKFLGFVLRPGQRRLQQGALTRLNRQLRRWRWLRARGLLRGPQATRHKPAAGAGPGGVRGGAAGVASCAGAGAPASAQPPT